ncbi:MAG: magnesium protoporphyrin IX methyltransferase [Gammaproteobacteria bacterium]|nr:magnesium protoporphyrin IX methyltransferase [Gammaproteobacteria bacterium]
MAVADYHARRGEVQTYFDRTAAETWARLTSTAPVGRIRSTVRAGRDEMRRTLLAFLPSDLSGRRLLDAGCGTGLLAVEAARRGADVLAVDLSPTLIGIGRERLPADLAGGRVDLRSGDMLDAALGGFDHVVAMDSLIHYRSTDAVRVIGELSQRTRHSIVFTFAPRTAPLAAMHALGRLFPRSNRAPSIEPVAERRLRAAIRESVMLRGWRIGRTRRVVSGFYTSQALELVRA